MFITTRSVAVEKFARVWKRYSFTVLFAFLVGGIFDPRIALGAVICMVGPLVVAPFRGRIWCGAVCPRGSFFDTVVARFGRGKAPPAFFRSYSFRALVIACMAAVLTVGIARSDGSASAVGFVFYRLVALTTVVGVVLAFFFNHRSWCSFCPMGTIASLIVRLGTRGGKGDKPMKGRLRVAQACISCSLCQKRCPLGLDPRAYRGGVLSHPDCVQCGVCAAACPVKAIG